MVNIKDEINLLLELQMQVVGAAAAMVVLDGKVQL